MHLEILSPEQKQLLSLISHFKRKHYLVCGTAKRNKWKDYVDLFFILKDYFSFDQIATKAEELFFESYFNKKLFKGQLAYFADIDYSEEAEFLPGFEVSEDEVKSFLIDVATQPF